MLFNQREESEYLLINVPRINNIFPIMIFIDVLSLIIRSIEWLRNSNDLNETNEKCHPHLDWTNWVVGDTF